MAVIYPSTIPGVKTCVLEPAQNSAARSANDGGPKSTRSISIIAGARAQVSWRFLDNEYAQFIEFWRDTLLNGHRWFEMIMPYPGNFGPLTVRIIDGVYKASLSGHTHWDVTAELDIYDLRPSPNIITLSSEQYPLESIDDVETQFEVLGGYVLTRYPEAIDAQCLVSDATLIVEISYRTYELLDEAIDIVFGVYSGTLIVEIAYLTYEMLDEAVDVQLAVIDFELLSAAVSHDINPEAIDVAFAVYSGTLV